ncbi:MAG TPA: hypothetical protein PLU17_04830 [Chitinophagaceae bacterium]|nr:hypothetical protein [Chitinophagaceae bacterium]
MKDKDIKYLYERSLLIIDFMLIKSNYDSSIMSCKNILENTYKNNNLRDLKTLSSDISAWSKGMPKNEILELKSLLSHNFGEKQIEDKFNISIINKILKEGKISNEEDYRIIFELLNDITPNDKYYKKLIELELIVQNYNLER